MTANDTEDPGNADNTKALQHLATVDPVLQGLIGQLSLIHI